MVNKETHLKQLQKLQILIEKYKDELKVGDLNVWKWAWLLTNGDFDIVAYFLNVK